MTDLKQHAIVVAAPNIDATKVFGKMIMEVSDYIAASSMTSELAKGKSLEEALAITEEDIIQALNGLPEAKKHCSNRE